MVKPLSFKGDKRPKKRKRPDPSADTNDNDLENPTGPPPPSQDQDEADDSWVTAESTNDITGPIIFALPSERPTCLACDANGKVFTSVLENIIEGNLATAEPHDVRQVWIANRIAGMEGISFKGHHGRYLSCDKFGILSATKEAISPEESFLCIPSPESPGMFSIQTQRETFLTITDSDAPAKGVEIRGDAVSVSLHIVIRMQARFKPRLKASKEEKAIRKISRKELEEVVGRRLEDEEVRKLKRARREGNYHEAILDVRVKGKHDKFAC